MTFQNEPPFQQVRHFLSKSMPRSGHHFLISMLRQYFGAELRYCEYYQPKDCCHSIPCSRAYDPKLDNRYFIQKSHDFKLLDGKIASENYIIQYRSVHSQIQSYFDFALKTGSRQWDDSMEGFRDFAKHSLAGYLGFYNKWIADKPPNSFVLSYDQLADNTEEFLRGVIAYITGSDVCDEERLKSALWRGGTKINVANSPMAIRDPELFRHFDLDFYRELEREVVENCPNYQPEPRFLGRS